MQYSLEMLHLEIPVVGLIKDDGHNTANLLSQTGEVMNLDRRSDCFFLLTQIQDEVHRFAINYHKQLRDKAMTTSILDEIEGVGPKRKKELLKHFKSFKKLCEATVEQLSEVVPVSVAQEIVRTLRQ